MSAHCEWVVSNADIRARIIPQKILWMALRSTELRIVLGNTFDNRRYIEQCHALLDRYQSAHYPFKAPLNGHLVKIRHLSQDISSLHRDSPLWRVSSKYLALSTFFLERGDRHFAFFPFVFFYESYRMFYRSHYIEPSPLEPKSFTPSRRNRKANNVYNDTTFNITKTKQYWWLFYW